MEQIVKLAGRIAEVMPVVTGVSDRTGNAWKSQEYLFEYFAWSGAQYANRIVVRVFGEDDIAKYNLKQGEEVTITLKFAANKSKDGSRWFNEIRISNVERPQSTQQPANQAPQAANAPTADVPANSNPFGAQTAANKADNDDLPF